MTYSELLLSENWKSKRKEILIRDSYMCNSCSNMAIIENYNKGIVYGRDYFGGSKYPNCYFLSFFDNQGKLYGGHVLKERVTYYGEQFIYFELPEVSKVFNPETLYATYGKNYSLFDKALKLSQSKAAGRL